MKQESSNVRVDSFIPVETESHDEIRGYQNILSLEKGNVIVQNKKIKSQTHTDYGDAHIQGKPLTVKINKNFSQ